MVDLDPHTINADPHHWYYLWVWSGGGNNPLQPLKNALKYFGSGNKYILYILYIQRSWQPVVNEWISVFRGEKHLICVWCSRVLLFGLVSSPDNLKSTGVYIKKTNIITWIFFLFLFVIFLPHHFYFIFFFSNNIPNLCSAVRLYRVKIIPRCQSKYLFIANRKFQNTL